VVVMSATWGLDGRKKKKDNGGTCPTIGDLLAPPPLRLYLPQSHLMLLLLLLSFANAELMTHCHHLPLVLFVSSSSSSSFSRRRSRQDETRGVRQTAAISQCKRQTPIFISKTREPPYPISQPVLPRKILSTGFHSASVASS
jgi:hypothetical protein